MLNRRAFVQSLGIGTVGTLSLLETPSAATAAALQNATRRTAIPADAIRIGSNENPNGPTASAVAAAKTAALEGHRYAGVVSSSLIESIAAAHGVSAERIMLSGGSGDLLRAAVRAFTAQDRPLVTGSPSYEQPVRIAQQAKVPVHEVPLTGDLKLDLDAMLAKAGGSGLIYICNPNNPTSTIVPVSRRQATDRAGGQVVSVDDGPRRRGLLRVRGRPGVRDADPAGRGVSVGGHRPHLLEDSRHGGHACRLRHCAGEGARRHARAPLGIGNQRHELRRRGCLPVGHSRDAAQSGRSTVRRARSRVAAFEKAGYKVAASQANFVMVDVRRDVRPFIEAVRQKGVYIGRPFPPLTNWARITVGTQAEMDRALPIMLDVLKAPVSSSASAQPLPEIYTSWC